jgi:hypothetical protein
MVIFRARRKIHRSMKRVFEGLPPGLPVRLGTRVRRWLAPAWSSTRRRRTSTMANDWSATYGFEDAADVCERFQLDLSCLVDGEIDEPAAARAMVHLESATSCREFFDDTRNCVRLHRDVADPARLLARISSLTGRSIYGRASSIELVHKLATIFYQLGKAYVLAGTDPDYLRTHVFEAAVEVEPYQADGKRFVDGVIEKGEGRRCATSTGPSRARSSTGA